MISRHSGAHIAAVRALNTTALLGSVLLSAAWVFNITPLIRQIGPYADVHLGTVLGLLLVSCAAILPRQWRPVAVFLTGLVACCALLTLLSYTLRFPQPLDVLVLGAGLVSPQRSASLNMPFPTALSLLLVSVSAMILRRRAPSTLHTAFALALAVIGALVMVQNLLTQQFDQHNPDYAATHDVSLQGALLIVTLVAALALRAGLRLQSVGYLRLDHYFAGSTVLLFATFLVAWEYQEHNDWDLRDFETRVALKTVQGEIFQQIQKFGISQEHLASRWSIFGPQSQQDWESDASTVLDESAGLNSIAYVDRNRVVRWQVAQSGQTADDIGLNLDNDMTIRRALDATDAAKSIQMTQTIQRPGGASVRLFLTPVYIGTTPDGYLMATLHLSDLHRLLPSDVAQDFNIALNDEATDVEARAAPSADLGARVRKSAQIETFGQYWTLSLWPKQSYIAAHRSPLLLPTLVFGSLMTLLVAAAFSQTRQSQINLRREVEAKARLASTLDHITDGFLTLDRNWRITYANHQAALITGHSAEAMIGSSALDLSANLDGIPHDPSLVFAMEGRGTGQFTGPFKAGRALDATSYPTRDGIAVLFRDVTKERERDEHLRLLETAVARQNDVLIITDAIVGPGKDTQRIVYVNDAYLRLTGYSREETLGKTPRMLQGPATSRAVRDQIRQAVAQRHALQVELINYAKDGRQYWIELDIAPIFDAQGTCTHFVAVARDVTERKRIEAQSAYNLERFQHIVDATNDIIWDADLATGHVTYNENLQKILGYDPADRQLTTKDWEDWVHPDDRARVIKIIRDAIDTPTQPVDMEYRLRKADGTDAVLTDRAKVIRDAEGTPRRIVGTMSDVTERRMLADRLRQAQQLEAVGQLTGGVAHDFNNLLTVILGNSELLAEKLATQPKLQKLAEMTVTMALRGSELTNRLLAFARRQPLEPRLIEVNALIDAMKDWMPRTLPATIRLQIEGADDLWQIEADPHQLENALLNLAVNARDAMPGGGVLTIRTGNCVIDAAFAKRVPGARPGAYVHISVVDNGTGMEPATLARAFEPFFTTKAMGKGSGLGLSMVYGFLRQSAGFATIDSSLGQGTTVHLYFPRHVAAVIPLKPPPDTTSIFGGHEHILAVEDEENVLESVVAKLKDLGYRVSQAPTGTEALAILGRDASIDLLFTDIVMPGDLSGPDLVKRATAIRPGLKVLYTSGYTDDTILHDGKIDAGLHLLSKPYRLSDLAEKIRSVLEG